MQNKLRFAFFGTPDIGVYVLEELEQAGYQPSLVITNPDRPVGRKQVVTAPPVKVWAEERGIPVFQPDTFNDSDLSTLLNVDPFDLFIVAAYGTLIPRALLELPKHGTLNMHPSLLPKLRGASPIRSAILNDMRETGVTIMQMDTDLDHGPIVAQMNTVIEESDWPMRGHELDVLMAHQGGALLADIIPRYLDGTITPTQQNHQEATFCTKITKEMSELKLNPYSLPMGKEAYETLLKIRAFEGWPETFFMHKGKRVKIKEAELALTGQLRIKRIIPEGKSEMDFDAYFTEQGSWQAGLF